MAGGMEIFYGVIPSPIILGHPEHHDERTMHGGVPPGGMHYHLVVTLFDAQSKQRIVDARVQASITGGHMPVQRKALEPMVFAGATAYGNYFRFKPAMRVHVGLEVQRPGTPSAVLAKFDYVNPRGHR